MNPKPEDPEFPRKARVGATPAGTTAATLTGDLAFSAGGMPGDFLTGEFVKEVVEEDGILIVMRQKADGALDEAQYEMVSGAFKAVVRVTRYIASHTAEDFTEAAFLAGDTADYQKLSLAAGVPANAYLGFWQPATADEVTQLLHTNNRVTEPEDSTHEWSGPFALAVNSVDGYYMRSRVYNAMSTDEVIVIRQPTGLTWFPRYMAVKVGTDNVFVAADFTAAYPAASMSITWRLVQSGVASDAERAEGHWAYWVPENTPDIMDVRQAFPGAPPINFGSAFSTAYELQTGTVTVGGIDGKVWHTTRQLFVHPVNTDLALQGERIVIQVEGQAGR